MRQLFPEFREGVDVLAAYAAPRRTTPPDRPWVVLGMIASIDGATSVDGRSGPLGAAPDRLVFAAVRAMADVILVGAGTARAERYRPPSLASAAEEARLERGRPPAPRLALVSRRLDLDLELPAFAPSAARPLIVTTEDAPADRRGALADRADFVLAGRGNVDLAAALGQLRDDHGAVVIVCEGGPSLNGSLMTAGLVDEMCLSVAPVLVGGVSPRIVHQRPGSGASTVQSLPLAHVLECDDMLFLRYARH